MVVSNSELSADSVLELLYLPNTKPVEDKLKQMSQATQWMRMLSSRASLELILLFSLALF